MQSDQNRFYKYKRVILQIEFLVDLINDGCLGLTLSSDHLCKNTEILNLFELNCRTGRSSQALSSPDLQYNCLLRDGLIRLSRWMNLTGVFFVPY